MSHPFFFRSYAEISAQAVAHNLSLLRTHFRDSGRTRIMAVVKSDAYGHGIPLITPLCLQAGIIDFGVATVEEGISLRSLVPRNIAIYLLAPTLPQEALAIVAHDLIPLISDWPMGQALSEAGLEQGVMAQAHLDIDTGMGRSGAAPQDAVALLAALDRLPTLQITGLTTHFARAEDDPEDALAQHQIFTEIIDELGVRASSLLIHAANSPATLSLSPQVCHQMVRPGLLLYGIEPAPGAFEHAPASFQPVLSLKTHVTLCRTLPEGASISYGRTYRVPPGGGTYATLGIGYGDGYPRRLSNQGHVLIRGRRAPICGRVCMDQMVVDLSAIPHAQTGDVATLLGTDGAETITAGELASLIETTPHEITTALTARIPRIVV